MSLLLCYFYILLCSSKSGKRRLAKEGSLARHTHEKLSEITRGVTLTKVRMCLFWVWAGLSPSVCPVSYFQTFD